MAVSVASNDAVHVIPDVCRKSYTRARQTSALSADWHKWPALEGMHVAHIVGDDPGWHGSQHTQ